MQINSQLNVIRLTLWNSKPSRWNDNLKSDRYSKKIVYYMFNLGYANF